jgi:hypothetical protein
MEAFMENSKTSNNSRKDKIVIVISLLILSIFLYWDTSSISDWMITLVISIFFGVFFYALDRICKRKNIDFHFQILISSVLSFFFAYLLNLIILNKAPHYIMISSLFGIYIGTCINKSQGNIFSVKKLFFLIISLIVSYNVLFFVFDDRLAGMSKQERQLKHYLLIEKGYRANEIKDYYVSTFNLRISANVPSTEDPNTNYTYSLANVRFKDEMDSNYAYIIKKESIKQIEVQNYTIRGAPYKHIENSDVKIIK